MSEWREVTLADLLRRVRRKTAVVPGVEYPAVSVLRDGQGLGPKEPFVGDDTNYSTLFMVRQGDVVVRTITAFESPVAVADAAEDGTYVSQVFLTYETHPDVDPAYLRLYFQTPRFWNEMQNRATGTVLRRKTISDASFQGIPISLPPRYEQRRIVDVMAAVDAQIEALQTEARAVMAVWSAQVSSLDDADTRISLGQGLLSIEAGKSPKGEERTPLPGERAVLKISAVQRARFDPTQVKTVRQDVELPASSLIRKGDVLLVRCNALLERVGVVCQVPNQPDGLYLCDKTLRLVPNTNLLRPDYLSSAMSAPSVRRQIEERTAGSDMRNIGQKALREISVPVIPLAEQRTKAGALTGLLREASAVEDERGALRRFRSALLTSLLHHSISIPESYDALLEQCMGVAS